jgi:hypothetical protein
MLQIDHIAGATEAKSAYGRAGSNLYFLVSTGRKSTAGLQLLCANCNVLKRHQNEEHAGYKERKVNESSGASGEGKSEKNT